MNLKELGEHFRIERERHGLSIDDVVRRTKISKANVRALEDGDASLLPHPVYAKGFVRNYALLLGLNPEECVDVIAREFVAEDNVSAPQPALDGPEQEIGGPGGRKSGLLVLLAGLLAMVLVGGALYYWNANRSEQPQPAVEQAEPQAPEHREEPAPAQADAETAPQPAPAAGEEAAPEPAAQQAGDAQTAADAADAEDDAALRPVPAQEGAAPAGHEPAQGEDGRQRVVVTAGEACWIYAKVDGGDEAEGGVTVDVVLQPGQAKQLRFNREMVMKLGNAGGVRVTLNGKTYPVEALSGQVRTLTFSAP